MAVVSKESLRKFVKNGKTDAEIGSRYGVTRQAIHQLRKKHGIVSRVAKNAERNEKIVKDYRNGIPVRKIMKKCGLSMSQTYRVINA